MVDNIGNGMPVLYDYNNAYNGMINPSTVHVTNTGLQWYFKRYLLQKAMAVFEWTLPESWNRDYFLYVLYCWGFIGVVNTDKFGVICQGAALKGYGVYYQPTHLVIANPLLTGIREPEIGTQAALIKLQPDYRGVMDRINFYADMLALSAETAGVDLVNSRLAYVFGAQNKQQAESFKKMMDGIASGQPAQFVDKSLFNDDGTPNWLLFNQNIKNTYIAGDILDDMRKWELKFDTDFGINNASIEKKERMIVDEVNSNNEEIRLWSDLALEQLQAGCKQARDLFGINISVKYRMKGMEESNGTEYLKPAGTV